MSPLFEWDQTKAHANLEKHGVSFEEAATVFADPFAAIFVDPDHSSSDELREIIVGYSIRAKLLFVSFTEREGRLRIISSRAASVRERKRHSERNNGGHTHE